MSARTTSALKDLKGSPGRRAFLAMLGLVLLLLGGVAVLVAYGLPTAMRQEEADLEAAHRRARSWATERFARLELVARSLAGTRQVRDLLTGEATDLLRADVRTVLASPRRGIGEGLGAVLDLDGAVVVATDGGRTASEDVLEGLERPEAAWAGLRRLGEGLVALAAEPVVDGSFEDAGWVVVGLPLEDTVIADARPAGGEAVLLRRDGDGDVFLDGTLDATAAERLLAVVQEREAAEGGDGEITWERRPHRVSLEPLTPESDVLLLLLAPVATAPLPLEHVWIALGGVAVLLGLLAGLLARWVGAGARRPARVLAGWLEAVREDREDLLPAAEALRRQRGFFQPTTAALARWWEDLGSRRQVRERLGAIRWGEVAEPPGPGESPVGPGEVTLALFELRHHARRSDDPAGRFARDLERVRGAARARGGRVEAVLGHRLLVVFSDGGARDRRSAAVAAVAEALRRLALPEAGRKSVEPAEPPVVAMADGPVTRAAAGASGRTVVGLPVQELESLAREGAPGQVVLSGRLARALEEDFAAVGVTLRPQSGLLSLRPVYVLERDDLVLPVPGDGEPRPAPPPEPGDVLGDRFEIHERVGRGPLGAVYEAADRHSGRTVALKLLESHAEGEVPDWEGLDSPLRGLPSVSHPRLARVYEYGRLEEPGARRFLTRRLIPGIPWRALEGLGGPARWDLTAQLAAALAALHEQEVFHGRLHGGNVFVEPSGRLVLTDFGLAPWAPPALDPPSADDDPRSRCLAPEQEDGDPGDARSDVHAWGLLVTDLYDLNGEAPEGDGEPAADGAPGSLPEGLRELRDRALAADPADRFADGGELWAALRELRRIGDTPPW